MFKRESHGPVLLATALGVLVGMGLFTGSAMATCTPGTTTGCQLVSGTTAATLSLDVPAPATFGTTLAPNTSPTGTGTLVVTDTNSPWVLQAQDANTGASAGHMLATGATCTGSDPLLANALGLSVSGGGGTPASITLGASPLTVESGTTPLAASTLTTNYTVSIPSSEVMVTGCVYSLTTTYTLQ